MTAPTSLRLPTIREKIIEIIAPHLSEIGFKVKSRTGENFFLKKNANGYSKIQFFYSNYFPIDYEVYLSYGIMQENITSVMKEFRSAHSIPFYENFTNIGFGEGQLLESLKERPFKSRAMYRNRLRSESDLLNIISHYESLITDKIIPYESVFSTLEGTNEYLKNNTDFLENNCATTMMETSLICADLLNDPDYIKLFKLYISGLSNKEEFGILAPTGIDILNKLNDFLKNKSPNMANE